MGTSTSKLVNKATRFSLISPFPVTVAATQTGSGGVPIMIPFKLYKLEAASLYIRRYTPGDETTKTFDLQLLDLSDGSADTATLNVGSLTIVDGEFVLYKHGKAGARYYDGGSASWTDFAASNFSTDYGNLFSTDEGDDRVPAANRGKVPYFYFNISGGTANDGEVEVVATAYITPLEPELF